MSAQAPALRGVALRGAAELPSAARASAAPDRAPKPLPPVALYVHVPFCVSVCPYCDFVVYAGAAARGPRSRIDAFLRALRTELRLRADRLDTRFGVPGTHERAPLASVYLGGGTPTLLPSDEIARLIDLVRQRFGLAPDAEVTIEANPGPDERGDPPALVAAGITRISFGAQSFDAALLATLGRRHRPADTPEAVLGARAAGIPSVSLDLLYDVPGQSVESWSRTLDAALGLEPDHVSAYALTLDDPEDEGLTGASGDHLPTRSGARRWRAAAAAHQDADRAAAQYELALDRLTAAGFRAYEISNWAGPDHESRHNLAYWRRRSYEAVGPGAHAFDGATRRWNAARLDEYVEALVPSATGTPPRLPPGGSEEIAPATAELEAMILGLRLDEGVALDDPDARRLAPHLGWAVERGLLVVTGSPRRARLTARGRLLSNELFARLV